MANGPEIAPEVLARVAGEIAQVLANDADSELVTPMARRSSPLEAPHGETGIAESFEIWRVDLALLRRLPERADADLREVARPDERWHHQIRALANVPTRYARSSRREGEAGALLALFDSGLAAAIDEAVTLVDDERPDDSDVHLLVLPELYVTALWVVPRDGGRTRAVIVEAPGELRLPEQETLPGPTVLGALRALDREVPRHPELEPLPESRRD